MELFIFIVFQLLMEVQSYNALQKPFISVSDDDVQLSISCEIPHSVRADFNCSLYTEEDVLLYHRDSQWSQSAKNHCVFYVSRSELLTRSVNSRQLICVYSLKTEPEIKSLHSDTYTFRDTYTIRVSTPTTTEHTTTTATTTFSTSTTTEHTTTTATTTFSTPTTTEHTTTTATTPSDVQSKTNLPTSTAKETLTALTVMSTSETTTYSKTDFQSKSNLPTSTATETMVSMATSTRPGNSRISEYMLVSSGVAVILSGLICFFCWFASKKRRKLNKTRSIKPDVTSQGIGMSCSGPAETYCLSTFVPATSQPISVDVLVNKQQKQGNLEENENVYHLYSTIPDKPVHSNTEDHVYSFVKMH